MIVVPAWLNTAPRVETDTTIFVELQVALDKPVPTGSILRLCLDISEYDPLFFVAEVVWQQFNAATGETHLGFKILPLNGTDYAAWEAAMAEIFA
jgi:hypothetical protein